LWERVPNGGSSKRKFFFSDLKDYLKIENLLMEAYILVSKCSFTYADVKDMTKVERVIFLKLFQDDLKAQKDAIEQH
jgi:hypothetical protein